MPNHKFLILILLFFISFNLTTAHASTNTESKDMILSNKTYFEYFTTAITIKIYDSEEISDSQWVEIENILIDVQTTFKRTYDSEIDDYKSELFLLNQSAGSGVPYSVSDGLFEVIKIGIEYAELTNGRLDPTIGTLVDLWDISGNINRVNDFDNPQDPIVPTKEQIESLLPLVDYKKVILDENNKTVLLEEKGMVLDLGAIAKGYAADKLTEYFDTQGFKHAIIDLGGNIYAYGDRHKQRDDGTYNWGIAIRDPKGSIGEFVGLVYGKDITVVSSGTYEKYFYDPNSDKTYHHILDTTNGYPVENELAAVTIITTNSTKADALSTGVFSLGLTDGLEFIEGISDTEAIFIDKDNKIYKTSGVDEKYYFKSTLEDTNDRINVTQIALIGIASVVSISFLIIILKKYLKQKAS